MNEWEDVRKSSAVSLFCLAKEQLWNAAILARCGFVV